MATDWGFHTTGDEVVAKYGQNIEGKTVIITGAGENGLGAGAAIALAAAHPAHLILTARSKPRVESVIKQIQEKSPSTRISFVALQLNDFDNVRTAAKEIESLASTIDVLINNAGVMAIPYATAGENTDLEMTLATNHLGGFLLTGLLMPKILAAAPGARVITMTSSGHSISPFRFDDYNFQGGKTYNRWHAYGQSKTANIFHAKSIASKYGSKGILAFAVHPGGIYTTSLIHHLDQAALDETATAAKAAGGYHELDSPKSLEEGISTMLVATLSPEIVDQNGSFMADCQTQEPAAHARSLEDAERLWVLSESLVGEKFS